MTEQTPEQLLDLILESDRDKQLKLCTMALDASRAASDCFMQGHVIEIDNLNAHIRALSTALVDATHGRPIDPGLAIVAAKEAGVSDAR